jgi:ubiquitin thioesterase OTU1
MTNLIVHSMATLNIKCRWPGGTKAMKTEPNCSWGEFRMIVESLTEIPANYQKSTSPLTHNYLFIINIFDSKANETQNSSNDNFFVNQTQVMAGFPPKEVVLDLNSTISGVIKNGDTINVSKSDIPMVTVEPSGQNHVDPMPIVSAPVLDSTSVSSQEEVITDPKVPNVEDDKPKRPTAEDLEGFETQSDYGQIVRRVMPDDNSCLFHTIAYVLENEKMAKPATLTRLRNVIAKAVRDDEETFDFATLGKSNADYARWILQPNSWGGAIELSILSRIYATEIFALDVINGIGNCFGENDAHGRRVYVIFDGIHYDAIVLSPIQDELDLDLTEFKPWDQPIEQMAREFLLKEKKAGKFTDTQKFQILCQQCQTVLIGEKGAAMHAMTTGHSQFVEKR